MRKSRRLLKLEDRQRTAATRWVTPDGVVTVVNLHWFGGVAVELTYKPPIYKVANTPVYLREPLLDVLEQCRRLFTRY